MALSSMVPISSLPSRILTYASYWHPSFSHLGHFWQMCALNWMLRSFGRMVENRSFPAQYSLPPSTVGSGSLLFPILERMDRVCALSKRGFMYVNWNMPVMWSWMAPMIGPPNLGDRMCSCTFIRMCASALASSLCRTCRFISSPSKSALYGGQTQRFRRKVFPGMTFTTWAIMDMRCREGCLLNRTTSPSIRCLSTT